MNADQEREFREIENYPLERYPDYSPDKPPQSYVLHKISYLEEMEKTWGRKWGAQGIGRLREVGLVKPMDIEANPLWAKDPKFFLLRHGPIDNKMLELLRTQHQEYADLLKQNGVNINWIDIPSYMGPYGPMRKLYVAKFCCVLRGGAIISRAGQSSYRKGWEPHVMRRDRIGHLRNTTGRKQRNKLHDHASAQRQGSFT